MYPFEHARSCTCPCPACVGLHRQVLAHVGLLERDAAASYVFVYAHASFAIAESEGDDHGRHHGLYYEICDEQGVEASPTRATIGWLVPTDEETTLSVVRAASDPHTVEVDRALTEWGRVQGRVVDTRPLTRR